ncbi:MAG: acyloxyacyl hydrolase [Alphaproteobacteria bacterium]|nr:acyloxyacyl hydrolase [Alphaproteobacteria bacterium]
MRKFSLIFISTFALACASNSARADFVGDSGFHFFRSGEHFNPFFGTHQNQIMLNIGQGVDYGYIIAPPLKPVPYNSLQFQYSQPITFFRLPARWSFNIAMNLGWGEKNGWDWEDFSIPIAYLSSDAIFASWGRAYTGFGIGAGMQAQQNARIGSKLLFQFKWFAGYGLSDAWRMEIFMQHFSNGSTTPQYLNNSYLFWGLGIAYNF